MGLVSPTPEQLLTEAVIFWSIGFVLYTGRMVSRTIANGSIKRLFIDDYIMTLTFIVYTALLVLIQISARYATNLLPPSQYAEVLADPQQVKDRIFGSKIVIGLEQCMLFSTWGVKTCMLTLYWRMTRNTRMSIFVKILAVYVALGFFVIMVTYYGVYCRPFSQYWAMPVSNMQCATYQYYSITQAVFNISSDSAMLAIPIPLLIKAQIKLRKKALLLCVLSLGVFTIAAAIMNKYFNFASPLTTTYQIWYIREASTSVYVANMMCWWPLLRKIFGMKAFQYDSRRYRRQAAKAALGAGAGADDGGKGMVEAGYSPKTAFATSSRPMSKCGEVTTSASVAGAGTGAGPRASFSMQRVLNFSRNAYRKSFTDTMLTSRKTTVDARESEEAINKQSCEGGDECDEGDVYGLDEWDKLERQKEPFCYESHHHPVDMEVDVERGERTSIIVMDQTVKESLDSESETESRIGGVNSSTIHLEQDWKEP